MSVSTTSPALSESDVDDVDEEKVIIACAALLGAVLLLLVLYFNRPGREQVEKQKD
eukprot:UN07748